MSKVKIDKDLAARAADCARELGYSSVDEFVEHLIEKALAAHEEQQAADRAAIEQRLEGLGYIE
jgi:hypothetical protein